MRICERISKALLNSYLSLAQQAGDVSCLGEIPLVLKRMETALHNNFGFKFMERVMGEVIRQADHSSGCTFPTLLNFSGLLLQM